MKYELQDLGVEHAQYFQGAGTAFTEWDAVYVGNGPTLREAIDDALEGAAQSGVDTTDIDPSNEFPSEDLDRELSEDAGEEVNHYAALYVRDDPTDHFDEVRYIATTDGTLLYRAFHRHGEGHMVKPTLPMPPHEVTTTCLLPPKTDEVLALGREHPLSDAESVSLIEKSLRLIRDNARKRGDTATVEKLEAMNLTEVAEKIVRDHVV